MKLIHMRKQHCLSESSKERRTSCLSITKNRGDTLVLDWSVADGWGKSGCSLLPSFIHLAETSMTWTDFSTFGHVCFSWYITTP